MNAFFKSNRGFLVSMLIFPFIALFTVEALQRGSIQNAMSWFFENAASALVTFLFILLAFIIVLMLSDRPIVAASTIMLPLCISAVVSYNKMSIRELPLLPWNMLLTKELIISASVSEQLVKYFILGVLICAALTYPIYRLIGIKFGLNARARLLILVGSMLLLFPVHYLISTADLTQDTRDVYLKNGFISAFASYLKKSYMQAPMGYSKDTVAQLYSKYKTSEVFDEKMQGTPDIIMVMGESFWDPTKLKRFTFSQDPVTNLHSLQKQSISGNLIVNAFGGNTTNTEFEVLTGLCMSFIAPDTSAYVDFYKGGAVSLPMTLEELGYECEAIHLYDGSFLSRNKIYKDFGFKEFITQKQFAAYDKKTGYISDLEVTDQVIKRYQSHKKNKPSQPYFSFSVTMQNHYDYDLSRYQEENKIEINHFERLDKDEAAMLSGYVQGVRDTDKMLGTLKEYFSKQSNPVILIFFGDHLPAVGKDQQVYLKGGLFDNSVENEEHLNQETMLLHTVPFVIWDNFRHKSKEMGNLNAAYLQSVVFKEYGLPMTFFQNFLSKAMEEVPQIGLAAWPTQREKAYSELELVKEYQLLQYDVLFGEGYSKMDAQQ